MAAARTLLDIGVLDRELHLFDTYKGMSEPQGVDVDRFGMNAIDVYEEQKNLKNGGCQLKPSSDYAVLQIPHTMMLPFPHVHYAATAGILWCSDCLERIQANEPLQPRKK